MGASLGSLFLAVLLTQSRGGMIVVLVATVFIVMARYGWKVAGSCLVLLMVGGLLIPTPLRERVQAEHQQNPLMFGLHPFP